MKLSYRFSNLCGVVYKCGNVLFSPDGMALLSPVGNRVTVFDLVNSTSATLPFESRKNIRRLALSPDGKILVVVDVEGKALIVNLPKKCVLYHASFSASVSDMQFSPSGDFLAVTDGRKLQIWRLHVKTRQFNPLELFQTIVGHQSDIQCIHWSQSGEYIFTGSSDLTARMHSLHTRRGFRPQTLGGHRSAVIAVFFQQKKRRVYTVARDGAVIVWKWTKKIASSGEEAADGAEVGASDEGSSSSTEDDDDVSEEGEEEGLQTEEEGLQTEEEEEGEESLAPEPESSAERKSEKRVVREETMFNASTGRWRYIRRHLAAKGSRIESACFHTKSNLLVLGLSSGVFVLYQLRDMTEIHSLSISRNVISSVAINSSGEWLGFGSSSLGQLLVWEWQSETYILKQQGHFYDLSVAAYSPDGSLIATGGDDGKVKLWNTNSGLCFVTFSEHTAPVTGISFVGSGHALVSSSLDGTVRAFDLLRYRNFRTMTAPSSSTATASCQFSCVSTDSSGDLVAAGALDPFEVFVWSLQTGRLLDVLVGHEGPISTLSFAPNSTRLASGSWDKSVMLWDVAKTKEPREQLQHSSDVLSLCWRPDGKVLCVSSLDGTLRFWDVDNGNQIGEIDGKRDIAGGRKTWDRRTLETTAVGKCFTSICYSADGECVLAGGRSKYICIYEAIGRLLLKKYQISYNRSLDGIVDYLNSANITEAGPLEDIDTYSFFVTFTAAEERVLNLLCPVQVRSKCVVFSPDGESWSAATSEGLLVYSLDDFSLFQPLSLDVSVTPAAIDAALANGETTRALLMSFQLNERSYLIRSLRSVPPEEIPLVVRQIPSVFLPRMLEILAEEVIATPFLHFYLRWSLSVLQLHGETVRRNPRNCLNAIRSLLKAINYHQMDLLKVTEDNKHLVAFLCDGEFTEPSSDDAVLRPVEQHGLESESVPSLSVAGEDADWEGPQ